jgi:hypothetical protein
MWIDSEVADLVEVVAGGIFRLLSIGSGGGKPVPMTNCYMNACPFLAGLSGAFTKFAFTYITSLIMARQALTD